jgi:hypothetical protein
LSEPSGGEGGRTSADGQRPEMASGSPPGVSGAVTGSSRCRFELTPPRHFLYPAILLLLVEQPRHGYRVVDAHS